MAKQSNNNTRTPSDEIDLGQLLQIVRNGFQSIFRGVLRVFLYFKKRARILIILIVIGSAIGFILKSILNQNQKIEIIVKPNLESKNYLYDVIDEIQANITAKDTTFFKKTFGLQLEKIGDYEITVEPVESKTKENGDQLRYLELLQKFESTGIVGDVLRAEILDKSSLNHRITVYYKDRLNGPKFAQAVVSYINSNAFFNDLVSVNTENAKERIRNNEDLIDQIDQIIANYSARIGQQDTSSGEGKIVLENEERLNITGLFDLKNNLIHDMERKKLELLEQKEAISIVNFGKPQEVIKPFYGKKIVLLPLILVSLFFYHKKA